MPPSNRLIESLPLRVRDRLLRSAVDVELSLGNVLYDAGTPLSHAYFPRSGFISLMTTVDAHQPLELALIGNEGMLGATALLEVGAVPMRSVVQGSGSAWRLTAAQFRRELDASATLTRTLRHYLYVSMLQLAQNSACQCFHRVDARLARWLLMTHDRSHADHFQLTHAFLADMLGVRRSAVTVAAGALQRRKIIRYSRGEISVLAREKLEAESCSCYAAGIEAYARLLP
jgi:CRP-like cAMP-binding protein